MVDFSVFNELSLPLSNKSLFGDFFKLLETLKKKGLNTIRMNQDFTSYLEILPNTTFQAFFGQLKDKDEKTKLRTFINNGFIVIESPLIKDEEIKNNENAIENEYSYSAKSTFGGLACCDIWNTIAVSFKSSNDWDKNVITLQKNSINVDIRHASKVEHLDTHTSFFEDLETEIQLNITKPNFWKNIKSNFPKKLIFCREVEKQIQNLNLEVFKSAVSILRDIETGRKKLTSFTSSGESDTVKTNPKLKELRMFTIDNKKEYFDKHIKNLPNGNRIYFLEKDDEIHIGYIGGHLPTKKYK